MTLLQKLLQWNRFVGAHFPWFVLACAVTGVLFPDAFSWLNGPITMGLFAFMTFANSLGSSVQDLARVLSHPKPVLVIMLTLHILMPLLALGIGSLCFPSQPLYTLSLVLLEASPAAVSALMWVVVGSGSVELCLSIILLETGLLQSASGRVFSAVRSKISGKADLEGTRLMRRLRSYL